MAVSQLVAPILTYNAVTGVAQVGATLTESATVVGFPAPVVTYQWYANGKALVGATGASYTPVSSDMGATIGVIVTATNSVGTSSSPLLSAGVVTATAPTPPTPPTPTPTPTPTPIPGGPPIIDLSGGNIVLSGPSDLTGLGDVSHASSGFGTTPGGMNLIQAWNYARRFVESDIAEIDATLEGVIGSAIEDGTFVAVAEGAATLGIAIGDIEFVGFAAAILLGEYVFGWVLDRVRRLFPNPSFWGWHPLGFIQDGLGYLAKNLTKNAEQITGYITTLILSPVKAVLGFAQRVANAIGSGHNKAAQIVNSHIPLAVTDGVTRAKSYTDGQITDLTRAEQAAIRQLRTDLNAAIRSAASTIAQSTANTVQTFDASLITRLQADEDALTRIATEVKTTIPAEIEKAVNDAVATEDQRFAATVRALQSQVDALTAEADQVAGNVAAAQTDLANARADLAAAQAQPNVNPAVIAAAQATITAAEQIIASGTDSLGSINTKITGISTTLGQVQAAQQLNTAQLAPFEGAGSIILPTVLATLAATLSQVKNKVDTCVVTTCDSTSPNHIKNVLKDLLMAMSTAGELAFIAEAVRDPLGTANAVAPVLESVDASAVATLNALLSL